MSPTQILLQIPTGFRLLQTGDILRLGDQRWNDRYCRWEDTVLVGKAVPPQFYYIRPINS